MKEGSALQDVGKLFPAEGRPPSTVSPDATVEEALRTMVEGKFSLLPVVQGGKLRGVFSLWTLARLLQHSKRVGDITRLSIDDAMDPPPRMATTAEGFAEILRRLETDEAVLFGAHAQVHSIVTAWDILMRLYEETRAYVLVGEIELALRDVIARCIPSEQMVVCLERSLRHVYGIQVPKLLHELNFDDYRLVITSRQNWELFQGTLGTSRSLLDAKLLVVRKIRNSVFHFRPDDLSALDYDQLIAVRGWLLERTRRVQGESSDV
jgi:CBS domain-containing protein